MQQTHRHAQRGLHEHGLERFHPLGLTRGRPPDRHCSGLVRAGHSSPGCCWRRGSGACLPLCRRRRSTWAPGPCSWRGCWWALACAWATVAPAGMACAPCRESRRALRGFGRARLRPRLAPRRHDGPRQGQGLSRCLRAWDPSLAFVMGGAVGVGAVAFQFARRRTHVWSGAPMAALPARERINAPLLAGGVLFGIGWGIAGFCPGPAIVAAGAGFGPALWFVPAMLAGMLLHDEGWARWRRGPPMATTDPSRPSPPQP